MEQIIANNNATQTVITPVGNVAFENGVATNFNKEQAEYFEGQEGYELNVEAPATEKTPAKSKPDKAKAEAEAKAKADEEAKAEPEEPVDKPVLPVLQNRLKEILAFAELHKVDLTGVRKSAKKPVLEAIYAHFEG